MRLDLRDRSAVTIVILTIILTGAAGLRLHALTFQSFWLDELFSMVWSRSDRSVADIVRVYVNDVHPLGHTFLLHGWLIMFGDTDLAGRSLSAVLGIVGAAVMFLAGHSVSGSAVGLCGRA